MTLRRLRRPGERDRWSEGLGAAVSEGSVGGEGCEAEIGEGGEVLRGDGGDYVDCEGEEASSCCSNSPILFCASYNSASFLSSSSRGICLLCPSVSLRPSRVAFTLSSRLEFSASFLSRYSFNNALTSSSSASVGVALSVPDVAERSSNSLLT